MSRHPARLFAAAAMALTTCPPIHAQDPEIPDLILSETRPEDAVWVSADRALDDHGQLRIDYLSQVRFQWDLMASRGAIPADGCLEEGMELADFLPYQSPFRTLVEVRANATAIVRGTVAGKELGFSIGHPGQLLRLDPVTVDGDLLAKDGPLYLYYPKARFTIGAHCFVKTDPRAAHEPQLGDEILIFVRTDVPTPDRRYLRPLPEDVFIRTAQGELIVPEILADDPAVARARELDDLLTQDGSRQ